MADTERIVCYDRPNDNNALLGALMSRNNNSFADVAALSNKDNIMLLFLLSILGRGYNDYPGMASTVGENYNSRQIASLQDTVNSNHNNTLAIDAVKGNGTAIAQLASNLNCDFNTMQNAISTLKSAIDSVGGQTNALGSQMASNFAAQQLQACKDNGSVISRIDQLANGMTQGFASIGYQMAADKAEMIAVDNANTQRILDKMCADRTLDLSQKNQDLQNKINTMEIIEKLKNNGCCGCN